MDTSDQVHQKLSVRTDRGSRLLLGIAALALAGALLLSAFGYYAENARPKQWNPLGRWSIQQVTNGPVIHLGHTVNVTATKCANETVQSRGTNQWEQVPKRLGDPLGAIVGGTSGTNIQVKGCHTFHYKNVIPIAVQNYVQLNGPSKWLISGTATPYKDSGEIGQARTWMTTPFTVAP